MEGNSPPRPWKPPGSACAPSLSPPTRLSRCPATFALHRADPRFAINAPLTYQLPHQPNPDSPWKARRPRPSSPWKASTCPRPRSPTHARAHVAGQLPHPSLCLRHALAHANPCLSPAASAFRICRLPPRPASLSQPCQQDHRRRCLPPVAPYLLIPTSPPRPCPHCRSCWARARLIHAADVELKLLVEHSLMHLDQLFSMRLLESRVITSAYS
uniref:Uncharacterized protein n=1 Tax=Zea mays TaxID=4577 RepID=A0A804P3U5_MAIZE